MLLNFCERSGKSCCRFGGSDLRNSKFRMASTAVDSSECVLNPYLYCIL